MAINLTLTSSGLSVTANHLPPATPEYKGHFSLTSSLQLTVTFSDIGKGNFNYDVGFVASDNNNHSINKSGRLSFGETDGGTWGYGNSVKLTADLSSFSFPIRLKFRCVGCDDSKKVLTDWQTKDEDYNDGWIITDGRHTHITTKPAKPKITASTGTTMTVESSEGQFHCTTKDSSIWYNESNKFTGLSKGTEYTFKSRKICPDCPDNKVLYSDEVKGKTWSISGKCLGSGVNSMTFQATHVAGAGSISANDRTITYKLYKSKNTSGTVVATKTGNNGTPVKFDGLTPNTKYYCYAYTTNLGSGDNNCWIDASSTGEEPTVGTNTSDVSATTLRTSVSWSSPGAKSVTCTVECNGSSRSISSSGSYVGFTGLTPGVNYTVSWKVVSIYEYKYTYTYKVIEDGKEVEKTGTKTETETVTVTGSNNYTTKITTIIFDQENDTSSKIIRFKSKSNYSSDTMQHKVENKDINQVVYNWTSTPQNEYTIFNNLPHNGFYYIYSRIKDCYAFDSNGNQTNVNDSEVLLGALTKRLTLAGSIVEEHQHSIITKWQAYVNDIPADIDSIDLTEFNFTFMDTKAIKRNPPYQSSEVSETKSHTTSGDYQSDKKIYSNNLTWYYCEYIISATITDGYNQVSAAVIAHTTFPYTWIYSGGRWQRAMPHIFTDGKWVPAPIFVCKDGKFIEPNGE